MEASAASYDVEIRVDCDTDDCLDLMQVINDAQLEWWKSTGYSRSVGRSALVEVPSQAYQRMRDGVVPRNRRSPRWLDFIQENCLLVHLGFAVTIAARE